MGPDNCSSTVTEVVGAGGAVSEAKQGTTEGPEQDNSVIDTEG